ncbi:MAG: acyl-CoA dehydrogenase family protein, partial [Myxococcota bacterium]
MDTQKEDAEWTSPCRTRAEPEGERFVLSGTKNFTSGADVAEHVMVLARTPEAATSEPRRDGFTLFLVPTNAKGLRISIDDTQIP